MSYHRYKHIESFVDLDNEINRKELEVALTTKQLEIMFLETKQLFSPQKLMGYALKKGLAYVSKFF
jgi:hypothetical protein